MASYIEYAKAEFKRLGYIPVDKKQEEGPNKWIQENVLALLEVFSKQGHSGSSAPFCVEYFRKLASFEPLSPITGEEDEWFECSKGVFQNRRLFSVFKEGKDGHPHYLNAIVWRNQKGYTYTGTAIDKTGRTVKSHQYIRFPFTPKTFYVDVIEKKTGKGGFEFYIKDMNQLKAVTEYYNFKFD